MVNFSCCLIVKNEQNTLPKLLASLTDFKSRGGEVVIVDTGSTDNTVQIAKDWGCKVDIVGAKFITEIDNKTAKEINKRFIVDGEQEIVKSGDKLFDFASARNYSASLASNDMICTLDSDEVYTKFDIDRIEQEIKDGWEQFEYQFVFAHNPDGSPAIQFKQSKFFDRRKVQWSGIVHEVLGGNAKIKYLDESIIKLEHWQELGKEHRSKYMVGLALDCFLHQDKDRQSHYLARELMWTGRPKSALKEFQRHITMNGWPAEKAQSYIFMGDCYGMLNLAEQQVECYNKAIYIDGSRREAYIKLARFYQRNNNPKMALIYAKSATELPWVDYYANDARMYNAEPHEIMYWAYGWLGDISNAQKEIDKALKYEPFNQKMLSDTKYYFSYPDSLIDGWMTFEECQFLYNISKKMGTVCEIGSWKGRSTHALLSGGSKVTAVDTFKGSADPLDWTHELGKKIDVLGEFKKNVGHFPNLKIIQGKSTEVAKTVEDKEYDMVFIDAGHTYEELRDDIRAWKGKAKIALCGHDYFETVWMGVVRAVDEELGGPDEVHETIWVKWINRPLVSIVIPTLGRPDKLHRLLQKIKENAGYDNYEVLVGTDEFPPNNIGAPKMVKRLVEQSKGELVMFLGNDCIPEKDFLQLAVFRMIKEFPEMDGLIGLNDGYWKTGEFATHWLASKKLLPYLGGEFFHTGYFHCGCDNELTEMCRKADKYVWAEEARVDHDHPVKTGFKSKDMDEVYKLAYQFDRMEHDKNLLHERSKLLGFELHENFVEQSENKIEIPEITKFTKMIEECSNFSFIKLGDGEIYCMNNVKGKNCDGHDYSEALGKDLINAYTYLNKLPNSYITTWIDKIDYESPVKTKSNGVGDMFLQTKLYKEKYDFYNALKLSKRKKVFIGPKRLKEVNKFLNTDEFIEIPETNCYLFNFDIKPEKDTIYMFSAGMPSKVWIAQLLKLDSKITCIDFGSAFDPIFFKETRTGQLPTQILKDYYKKLL
jgi:glycosyltransferase involved in cell wall biosynthesis